MAGGHKGWGGGGVGDFAADRSGAHRMKAGKKDSEPGARDAHDRVLFYIKNDTHPKTIDKISQSATTLICKARQGKVCDDRSALQKKWVITAFCKWCVGALVQ